MQFNARNGGGQAPADTGRGFEELYLGGPAQEEWHKLAAVGHLLMPDLMRQLSIIITLLSMFLGWLSVSLEVFLRHSFGERYLGWVRLYFAYSAMGAFVWITYVVDEKVPDTAAMLAYAGFIFFSLWHRIEIWDRNREGVHWHSMSFGVSHLRRIGELPLVRSFLPFLRNDWILYCWIEPGLCLAVAVIAIAGDQAIGLWLLTASLALWLKNQLIHSLHRSHVLQLIDSAIEAEYFNDAVEGKPKTETAGFSVSMPGKLRLAPGAATRPNAMADTVRQVLRPEHMAGD